MATELDPVQRRKFAEIVDKKDLKPLCPAKGALSSTCQIDTSQPITNDGAQTCFVMSFQKGIMDMRPSTRQVCDPLFNPAYQTAAEYEPEPDDSGNGFVRNFKIAVEGLLALPDITPEMIVEYNSRVMAVYQQIGEGTAEQGAVMEMNKFTVDAGKYAGLRKVIGENTHVRDLIQKRYGKSYAEMEAEYVAMQLKPFEKTPDDPKKPSVLGLKLEFGIGFYEDLMELMSEGENK